MTEPISTTAQSAVALIDRADGELADFALALITSRQNISPRRLTRPGPTAPELALLFDAAAAAPDHGQLVPWRFVVVPEARRRLLADVFALALTDRDARVTPEQIEAAREKAFRAPLLMLAAARLGNAEPNTPTLERMVAVGAAIQNMLLAAHAMGYGAGLTSGQAMSSQRMHALFELDDGDKPVCFVNIGSISKRKPPRLRPGPEDFTREL